MRFTHSGSRFFAGMIAAVTAVCLLAAPGLAAGAAQTDIGAERAEAVALERAGLTGEEVSRLRTVRDRDDGGLEYEVEFFTDEAEYDYAVDAATGEVRQESWEMLRRGRQADGDVGEDAAQNAALAHAELAAEDVRKLSVRKELDDGYLEYEVEFFTDEAEYDYVIDGAGGTVWQWEKTALPGAPAASDGGTASGDVGAETARDAALAHAGLTPEQVTRVHVEWEIGDDDLWRRFDGDRSGHGVYEISFRCDGYEYEYVVDGATGEILEYESEYDD